MEQCKNLKSLIPLMRVVKASIIDMHEDIGKSQELNSHWAARGLRKLVGESLRSAKRRVMLTVNHNTHTATLPLDFKGLLFVGIVNDYGLKEPLSQNPNLVNLKGIEDIPCADKCERCQQKKNICEELTVTEDVELVIINDTAYERKIIKQLYPNGDYMLETTNPVWNTVTSAVEYPVEKKFITNLSLKECGCLDTSADNLEKVKCFCPDVYCSYYAECCPCSEQYGSYRVFEDTGLIQFDFNFPFDKVYLEYQGFIPKINGEYQVPEVAFETLVEWTKFKSIEGKNSRAVSNGDKEFRWNMYKNARRNMEIILGRIKLSQIIQAANLNPKFD